MINDVVALDQFREEVRGFISEHLPQDLATKVANGLELEKDDFVRWQKILYANGWFAGAWPKEFGGQGWDLRRQLAFLQEVALSNAPDIIPYGVNMVGPVLYTFGTDAQKREQLPGILSSDVWWCQGYSEPGAGSDLASLKTVGKREGDSYVINGSKLWTTEAHWADMMHCLVRTANTGKRQEGISFFLLDMRSPGISVRPIVTIDGQHHTNAVFFDDVRVPASNLVGEEGQGWQIAKFLLGNERAAIADTGSKIRFFNQLKEEYLRVQADSGISDSIKAMLRKRFVDLSVQLDTLRALELRTLDKWSSGRTQGPDASMLKIRATELLQVLSEFALDLEGPHAVLHDPRDLHLPWNTNFSASQKASLFAHKYLYGRCWSIFGGTNEVQRNIIAASILPGK